MVPNEEIFEVLESYVDGALDAVGRAQVEKQLAGNPQLRKLVAELLLTRDMLRGLPREKAPAEVAETFQGSLERSALLGEEASGGSDVVFKINRWPQIMSVAAIVLLANGLAAIIYKVVLPNKSPRIVASSGASVGATDGTSDGAAKSDALAKGDESEARRLEPSAGGGAGGGRNHLSKMAAKPSGDPLVASKGADENGVAPNGPMKTSLQGNKVAGDFEGVARPTVGPDDVQMAQKQLDREAKPNGAVVDQLGQQLNEPLVLMVRSQDPPQANRDVAAYLTSNHIQYVALGDNAYNYNESAPSSANSLADLDAAKGASLTPNGNVANNVAGNGLQQSPATGNRAVGDNAEQQQQPRAMARNGGVNEAGNNDRGNVNLNQDNVNNVNRQQDARGLTQNSATTPAQQQAVAANQPPSQPSLGTLNQSGGAGAGAVNGGSVSGGFGAAGNNAATLRANTYRVALTRRQLQELKEQIGRRGNGWTEDRNEPTAYYARLDNGTATAQGANREMATGAPGVEQKQKAAQEVAITPAAPAANAAVAELEARKDVEPADRKKQADAIAMRSVKAEAEHVAEDKAPSTSQPAMPGLIVTKEAGEKSATTRPTELASAPAAAPVPTLKGLTEESPEAAQVEGQRMAQRRRSGEETAKDQARSFEQRQEVAAGTPSRPAMSSTTQPATMPAQAAGERNAFDAPIQFKTDAEDLPRSVLIVVNDQPVILPVVAEPTTQPAATAAPAPSTQPAAKEGNEK
jgi:hypothetical protein